MSGNTPQNDLLDRLTAIIQGASTPESAATTIVGELGLAAKEYVNTYPAPGHEQWEDTEVDRDPDTGKWRAIKHGLFDVSALYNEWIDHLPRQVRIEGELP